MVSEQKTSRPTVIRIRRSARSVAIHIILALCVGIFGLYLSVTTSFFNAEINFASGTVQLPLFLLLFLFFGLRPFILLYDQYCEISEHHIRYSSGLFSLRRKDISIPFEDLRGVRVDQRLLDRILGVGILIAWTHAASDPEIKVLGIKHPRKLAALVTKRIDEAILKHKK